MKFILKLNPAEYILLRSFLEKDLYFNPLLYLLSSCKRQIDIKCLKINCNNSICRHDDDSDEEAATSKIQSSTESKGESSTAKTDEYNFKTYDDECMGHF